MLLSAFIAISGKSYPRIHVYTCYPMRGAPLTGGLREILRYVHDHTALYSPPPQGETLKLL